MYLAFNCNFEFKIIVIIDFERFTLLFLFYITFDFYKTNNSKYTIIHGKFIFIS